MSVITWITDPYYPKNTPLQSRVQSLLQKERPIMSTLSVLERTITRYIYFFSTVVEYPPELAKLVYTPATIGLQSTIILPGEALGELIKIVKELATRYLKVRVESVTTDIYLDPTDDRNFIYLFQPFLASGDPVYRPIEELADFLALPLEKMVGWKLLSADPLTSYLLNQPEYKKLITRNYQGVYLVNIQETGTLSQLIGRFQQEIYFLNLKGYFVAEDIPLALISSFQLVDHGLNVYSGSDGNFTREWLRRAVENLQKGILPSVLLAGPWQSRSWTAGDESKLVLSLILSYLQLTQSYPELAPYLPMVGVTRGLDLRVNVASKTQIKNLLISFENWISTSSNWKVHPVDSLRQGVALRIYYQRKGVYPPSLITLRRGKYFVVLAVSESQLLPEIDEILQEIYQELPEEIPYDLESSGLISGYGAEGILGEQYTNQPILLPSQRSPTHLPSSTLLPSPTHLPSPTLLPSPISQISQESALPSISPMSPQRVPLRRVPLLPEPSTLPSFFASLPQREKVRR